MKVIYRKLSTWLLGLLGVSGCSGLHIGEVMYGCPYADFKIDATVSDENGAPLSGIEATPLIRSSEGNYYKLSEGVKTGTDGKVQISFSNVSDDPDVAVALQDVDGDANGGTFQADTVKNIGFTQTKKGKDWDLGDFEAKFSARLKKQQ